MTSPAMLLCWILTVTLFTPRFTIGQVFSGASGSAASWETPSLFSTAKAQQNSFPETNENSDDPGYKLYKSGYSLVLSERWEEARSLFSELSASFPESEYRDDALYWTGYSRYQNDELGEAIDAYNRVIQEFPGSQYYDDAVADLAEAHTRIQIEELNRELERAGASLDEQRMTTHARDLERQLRRLTWSQHTLFPGAGLTETDPETQLRVDALNALNPDTEDMGSFETLKEVALDQANPVVLREHAVHILSGANGELVLPIFVTLAKEDTDEGLRLLSLDYLAQLQNDRAVDALIEVFHDIPLQQGELTARVFYTIAEVGNDRAVDFLSTVARTHADLTLRREAVYYLGAIGSEESRSALQVILKGK